MSTPKNFKNVVLYCDGHIPGFRWLDKKNESVRLTERLRVAAATDLLYDQARGGYMIQVGFNSNLYLSGNTSTGQVSLTEQDQANAWEFIPTGDSAAQDFIIRAMDASGGGNRVYLDGSTGDGAISLKEALEISPEEGNTGTKWIIFTGTTIG
ncbi:MAG: hypothetical protein H6581_23375 [Bacteroidia bacterium]|nr:hypothetical protein [Bacteroidia bacterium]